MHRDITAKTTTSKTGPAKQRTGRAAAGRAWRARGVAAPPQQAVWQLVVEPPQHAQRSAVVAPRPQLLLSMVGEGRFCQLVGRGVLVR
eukprot:COSAG01_NODE_1436_length_10312_cov_12.469500_2_plen_88_part_00